MKRSFTLLLGSLLSIFVWSQDFQRTETGIKTTIAGKKIDVEIQWFNSNSLRVIKTPQGQSVEKKSLSVIAKPQKTSIRVTVSGTDIEMKSRSLAVRLDTQTGVLTYETRGGTSLLKELENMKAFTPFSASVSTASGQAAAGMASAARSAVGTSCTVG